MRAGRSHSSADGGLRTHRDTEGNEVRAEEFASRGFATRVIASSQGRPKSLFIVFLDCLCVYEFPADGEKDLLKKFCDGTPLVPAEVRKRWESSYGDKQGQLTLNEATGCDKCENRGYRGRLGIHELLVNSRAIKALVQTHARVEEIQKTALAEGMLTLKQDGIEKALQGKTDLAQVRAVAM